MWEMAQQQEQLFPDQQTFQCNACKSIAEHPVLPPCGHLHCWKCLHYQNQCFLCQNTFQQQELFVMFIDHEQPLDYQLPLPPKPKPKYSDKIRNSVGTLGNEVSNMRYQDNLVSGVQLAGYGYCPPLMISSLASMNQEVQEQVSGVKDSWRRIEWLLVVLGLLLCWII